MQKSKPGKPTVHAEVHVFVLPNWGHKGAVVCPWPFADLAVILLGPHSFLFSLETLLSSSFFTSFSFFSWCWSSSLGPFHHDWLQIYGHFLPAPAWDCWVGTVHISGPWLPGPQSQSLRFSTTCHKGWLVHHLLLFWSCLCLLLSKVSEAQLKTASDLGNCHHKVILGPFVLQ